MIQLNNPFMPNGISHCYELDESISNFVFFIFIQILKKLLFVNSGVPDQTPRIAASDLVLYCLPTKRKLGLYGLHVTVILTERDIWPYVAHYKSFCHIFYHSWKHTLTISKSQKLEIITFFITRSFLSKSPLHFYGNLLASSRENMTLLHANNTCASVSCLSET